MKKVSRTDKQDRDTLKPEYPRAELGKGVRGKYYERYMKGTNLALLAPDDACELAVTRLNATEAVTLAEVDGTNRCVHHIRSTTVRFGPLCIITARVTLRPRRRLPGSCR